MPSSKRRLGDFGEAAAYAHLLRKGYRILARNWRCQYGELDLVAHDGDQIVCVEVRTRRASSSISPEESITPLKRQRLMRLAMTYLSQTDLPDSTVCRIDLIAVEIDSQGRIARLDHLISAVEE
ncbi:YraN family protein [Candidatus Oscillochloris fontis]|uniref:YraN family protein n=1 Tax=Candidatus Oscillochloris fontis TaxID=2496868 RepID=UPI00101B6F37|nr:YraN family protein [Candidatus Oscillochloris fontis]